MDITARFQEEFHGYKDYEERMGNKLKFIYNVDDCKVNVYCEEWDAYDGYDTNGSPYYYSLSDTWENITILEFAKLMEFYLEFKKQFDNMGIHCIFQIINK